MKKDNFKQFYAYYDTIEETGEVIYCGKGNEERSNPRYQCHIRNRKYNDLKKKYKFIRNRIPTLDEDLALKLEDWLIEHYHTWIDDPISTKHACNIDGPGTNGGSKQLGKEHVEKIAQKNRGKKRSKEICEKISQLNKGENNPFWNKTHSLETCKHLQELTINKRGVSKIDLKTKEILIQFQSLSLAERVTKINRNCIRGCCQGKLKSSGGFGWKYINENFVNN